MSLWRAKPRKTPYGNAVRVLTVYAANYESVTLRHTFNSKPKNNAVKPC